MPTGQPIDHRVEEYKTLRSEIIRNLDAAERNMIACITANGVALAYGAKERNLFVLLLACLVPIYFWIQHTFYRRSIAKLAAYISVFLEGPDTKLMWETRVQKVDLGDKGARLAYAAKSILLPYPLLLIVSLLTAVGVVSPVYLSAPAALGLLLVSVVAIILVAKKTDSTYAELRKAWLEAFQAIKSGEEAATSKPIRGQAHTQGKSEAPNPIAPADA